MHEYGLLGVGEIAAAIVTGLCEGVEEPPTVLLSLRSRERAAALADRHPSVAVASDNQALVDGCAVLVLAIRPQDARAIPLPPVARRAGFTPVHPGGAAARDLFGRLGEAAVVEDEDAFGAMSVASGTIAAHLRYLAAIGRW